MSRGLPLFLNHPIGFEDTRASGTQRGFCTYVVDGDTYDILVDDGRYQYSVLNVRLRGVNTPEVYTSDRAEKALGLAAKDFARIHLLDKPVIIKTFKDVQTFGRWVADLWVVDDNGASQNVADMLIEAKLATPMER